jgi:cytochrome P450
VRTLSARTARTTRVNDTSRPSDAGPVRRTDGQADSDPPAAAADRDAPGGPAVPSGPDGLPLVGNAHALAADALGFYERNAAEHGGVFRYDVFGTESYLVSDPAAVRRVLVDDHDRYEKGEMPRDRLGSLLGDGLFLAEGDAWRDQRTAVRSAFFREQVAAYGDAMVDHARETVDEWEDGGVVEIDAAATDYAFAVLATSLLGPDVEAERDTVRAAATSITERYDTTRLTSFLPEWVPTATNRRYRRRLATLRDSVRDLVAERRAAGPPANPAEADDLLGTLVAAAEVGALDDDELVDNAVTFLFAGHETSALGLTYTLYSLASNPAVQERVAAEVAALDGPPTPAAVRDCPRLTAAVDEALRLYPPVHSFFREPTAPVTLGGYRIPEGVVLTLSPWTVHRDERWWDDAEQFRPGRWLRETADGVVHGDDSPGPAVGERPEYAYFPFGGGPRHCIGMRFARQELRLATAVCLRRCRLEAVTDDLEVRASANTRPANPVRVRVHDRDGQDGFGSASTVQDGNTE